MFDDYYIRMAQRGYQMGKALKRQSDMIMDATFHRDVGYRKCYLLDKDVIFPTQTLEDYKKAKAVFAGKELYDPTIMKNWHEIECKYFVNRYYSIQGDNIDYLLQFRPLAHASNPNIRVGAFVFVPDDLDNYNLWLIVARDDRPQFPQFYILRCNILLKWLINEEDRVKYEGVHVDVGTYFTWGVQRTQSSYNSGVWTDYSTTSVENQLKAWLQTNPDTLTLTYNNRFVISNNPFRRIAWMVTKVEDTTTVGLTKLTFAQQQEYDPIDNKNWVNLSSDNYSSEYTGVDYDFYLGRSNDSVLHTPTNPAQVNSSVISYSGVKPVIKIGGGYKTFTANLYKNGVFVNNRPCWHLAFLKNGATICNFDFVYNGETLICDDQSVEVNGNTITYSKNDSQIFGIQFRHNSDLPSQLKLKCLPILDMLGGSIVLTVDDESDSVTNSASLNVEVESL